VLNKSTELVKGSLRSCKTIFIYSEKKKEIEKRECFSCIKILRELSNKIFRRNFRANFLQAALLGLCYSFSSIDSRIIDKRTVVARKFAKGFREILNSATL